MVVKLWLIPLSYLMVTILNTCPINCNRPPVFIKNVDLSVIQENTPIGSFVFKLEAQDPENSTLRYGLEGTSLLIVDPKTGSISVNQEIDREKLGHSISFFVTCEDVVGDGHHNNLVRVPVTVFIIDENDNPPFFNYNSDQILKVNVSEDSKVGTIIVSNITAGDIDLVGSILKVDCQNCNQLFNIELLDEATANHISFSLSLAKQLEYQLNMDPIMIKVVVSDGFHETGLEIKITVLDVQNKPPVFVGSNTAVVFENIPIGSLVLTLKAVDGDFLNLDLHQEYKNQFKSDTRSRPVIYELLTNPLNSFSLGLKNGQLRVQNKLDKEQFPSTNGVITLKVKATEVDNINSPYSGPSHPFSSSITSVTITLQDVNDELPQFNKKEYHVTVPEGVPNGTPLSSLDMMIEDKDTGSNSVFNIALIDDSGIFSVEPPLATGSTSVSIKVAKGPLDYENPNQRKFILLVVATEAFTKEKFSSTATVMVEVEDVNDNQPTFDEEFYIGSVAEDAVAGTIIKTIKASDRDSAKLTALTYSLFGNGAEFFSVNPSTGVITVAECETPGSGNCIDFETRNSYYLSYQANDGFGQSTVVPLTIKIMDANDNPPHFSREIYLAVIDEGANNFEPPLKVYAKDADVTSIITYSILSGNSEGLFTIESRSGEIKVNKIIRSTEEKIQLKVQASDGGKGIATALVEISIRDANDNKPMFEKTSYHVTVSESAENGAFVEKVIATDADSGINAKINYFIKRGAYDTFSIDRETGVVTVSNTSLLDYDRRNNYEIQIIAVDQGVPSKTGNTIMNIKVINHNDKLPFFNPTTQRCQVNENSPIETRFCKLNATDTDADSIYSLRYEIVGAKAIDKNGLKIKRDDLIIAQQMFTIDPLGYLLISSKLNRDIAAVITLNVSVTDVSSHSPLPQVGYGNAIVTIIDHNDNPPVFSQPWTPEKPTYSFTILEEQPVGMVVANMLATDLESKISHYSIEPENEYFQIGKTYGVITIRKVIDFEKLNVVDSSSNLVAPITFNVFAYDSGIPQLSAKAIVTVNIININDNEPTFTQPFYNATVAENSAPGTLVITVHAEDADRGKFGVIKYSIISQLDYETNSGKRYENFVINEDTGAITVAKNANLDRESLRSQITLQVSATDNPQEGGNLNDTILGDIASQTRFLSVPVYITIADVNDNSPIFVQKEYYGTTLSHFDGAASSRVPVLHVMAHDLDEGVNGQIGYTIVSGNVKSIFEIDFKTGIIYAVKSPAEVNENIKEYNLKVEARDVNGQGPYFDETVVKIKVIEMNLHKPRFIMPSTSTIQFLENQKPGTKVLRVEAYDEDTGHNGVVRYSFKIDGSKNVMETNEFKIDPESGLITSKISFDREEKSQYELILSARDYLGEPQVFESLQKVNIVIKDIDDNQPEFIKSGNNDVTFSFSTAENEPRGSVIGRIKAVDRDENNKVYYFIINGNPRQQFYIDKNLGILYSNASFDRETQSEYYLVIKASLNPNYVHYMRVSDQSEGFTKSSVKDRNYSPDDLTLALVRVEITDVNDNKPTFSKYIYRAGVHQKAEIGRSLGHLIKAHDADQGANSSLIYTLSSIDLYRKGYDLPDKPVRPIPSPFSIDANTGKIIITQLMAQYPIDSRFVLHIEAREKASPHSTAYTKVYLWVYDESKLIRVTIKLKPEIINARKDEIESMLSNITEQRAIINEIKYHSNVKMGRLIKKWSDVYILVVDDTTFINLSPNRIISKLDSKAGSLDKEKTALIEEVAMANSLVATSSLYSDLEKFEPTSIIFVILLTFMVFGVVAMLVSCCCLKTWYHQKLIENASKTALKSKLSVINENQAASSINGSNVHLATLSRNDGSNKAPKSRNGSTANGRTTTSNADKRQQVPRSVKDNPLWTKTNTKFYEEQEMTFRLTPNGAMFDGMNGPSASNGMHSESEFNPYATLGGTLKTRVRQREPTEHNHDNQECHEMNEESQNNLNQNQLDIVENVEGEPQLVGHLL